MVFPEIRAKYLEIPEILEICISKSSIGKSHRYFHLLPRIYTVICIVALPKIDDVTDDVI